MKEYVVKRDLGDNTASLIRVKEALRRSEANFIMFCRTTRLKSIFVQCLSTAY